jgi:hypothetical protein
MSSVPLRGRVECPGFESGLRALDRRLALELRILVGGHGLDLALRGKGGLRRFWS